MTNLLENKYSTEEIFKIRYSDIDFNKGLKPNSLLNFFQDMASNNAEQNGFGYSYLYPKNMIWVLLKYRIEFIEYPTDVQDFRLVTEPRGCNKLFAYRNFELFSDNKLLARASSLWGIIDFTNMSMLNAETVLAEVPTMGKYEPREDDLKFNKIPAITNVDYEEEFKVRYSDIDVNMHANNSNYIIWALEPLAYEYRKEHQLKNIDIIYKKEIKYGERFVSKVQMAENNTTLHVIKNANTDEDLCLIKCEWV